MLFIALSLPAGASTPAMDFTLKSNQGDNLRLFDYRGRVVMLSFIKDRCRNCEQQLRALDDLQKRYGGQGLQILAIAADLSADRASALGAELKLSFPILLDHERRATVMYQATLMPLVVLVDKDGMRRYQHQDFRAGDEREYDSEAQLLLREWQ